VQIDVVRSGGIAGVTLSGRLDTSRLDAPARAAVEQSVSSLPFGAPRDRPAHPDGFLYDITVDGDTQRHTRVAEAELPAPLREQLRGVLKLG